MDEYLGIVKLFAGPYAPQGWAFCNGALLNINQNTALFAVIGTQYGGNGTTTFALPNLLGRVAVGAGNGSGLPSVIPGQAAGAANVTLSINNMPAHTHSEQFANVAATTNDPTGNVPAQIVVKDSDGNPLTSTAYAPATSALVPSAPQAIGTVGGSQPINTMPPYLGMNYIICINGLFPSRS